MNSFIRLSFVVLSFVANAARASHHDLNLFEMTLGGYPCVADKAPGEFIKDKEVIQVTFGAIKDVKTPLTVKFKLKGTALEQEITGDLQERDLPVHVPPYDPKKSFEKYWKELRNTPIPMQKAYLWAPQMNGKLHALNFDMPKLTLVDPTVQGKAYFKKKFKVVVHYNQTHETIMQGRLSYNGNVIPQNLHAYKHDEKSLAVPNIMYLDEQGWLRDICIITYTDIPLDQQSWLKERGVIAEQYAEISHGPRRKLVLDPGPSVHVVDLRPEGSALRKYYRLLTQQDYKKGSHNENREMPSEYIFTDGVGNGFLTSKQNLMCVLQEDPPKQVMNYKFKDAVTYHNWLITLQETKLPIVFYRAPPHLPKQFKKGFYRLNKTVETTNGVVQDWILEPKSKDSPVAVTINDILVKGKWSPIKSTTPTQDKNGHVVLDLSSVLPNLKSEAEYEAIAYYIQRAWWISMKAPCVKFYSKQQSYPITAAARPWLNKLIRDFPALKFEQDEGTFLEQVSNDTIAMRTLSEFSQRSLPSKTQWSRRGNVASFIKDISANKAIDRVDVSSCTFASVTPYLVGLADFDQVRRISGVKAFRIQEYKPDELRLELMVKWLAKLTDCDKLVLDGMRMLSGTCKQLVNTCLVPQKDNITHLSLFGVEGLSHHGSLFIEAVKEMPNLRYLSTLTAVLANDEITYLAKALRDKQYLKRVELTMPYSFFVGAEICQVQLRESWAQADNLLGGAVFTKDLAVTPVKFAIGVVVGTAFELNKLVYRKGLFVDPLDAYGIDFFHTFIALREIKSLKSLKMHIRNIDQSQEYIKDKFTELRSELKYSPVEIDFWK